MYENVTHLMLGIPTEVQTDLYVIVQAQGQYI